MQGREETETRVPEDLGTRRNKRAGTSDSGVKDQGTRGAKFGSRWTQGPGNQIATRQTSGFTAVGEVTRATYTR